MWFEALLYPRTVIPRKKLPFWEHGKPDRNRWSGLLFLCPHCGLKLGPAQACEDEPRAWETTSQQMKNHRHINKCDVDVASSHAWISWYTEAGLHILARTILHIGRSKALGSQAPYTSMTTPSTSSPCTLCTRYVASRSPAAAEAHRRIRRAFIMILSNIATDVSVRVPGDLCCSLHSGTYLEVSNSSSFPKGCHEGFQLSRIRHTSIVIVQPPTMLMRPWILDETALQRQEHENLLSAEAKGHSDPRCGVRRLLQMQTSMRRVFTTCPREWLSHMLSEEIIVLLMPYIAGDGTCKGACKVCRPTQPVRYSSSKERLARSRFVRLEHTG